MSVNIKNLGWWQADSEIVRQPQKIVLPYTDGRTFVVVADSNAPEPFAQNNTYGDGTDGDVIRVFEIAADGVTVVERATIAAGGALNWPEDDMAADLFDDGSIGITFLRNSGALLYRKVTIGTWAVAAVETVATYTDPATIRGVDIAISQAGAVTVGVVQTAAANPKLVVRSYTRHTGNAWVAGQVINLLTTNDPNPNMANISVAFGRNVGTAAARPLLFLVAYAVAGGADSGHRLYSTVVDEGTGGMAAVTLRATYLAGDQTTGWGGQSRVSYLFPEDNGRFWTAIMQGTDKMTLQVNGVQWNGNAFTEDVAPQKSQALMKQIDRSYRFGASFAKGNSINFYYMAVFGGFATPVNYVARLTRNSGSVVYSGPFRWDNMENTSQDRYYPAAGSGKFGFAAAAVHGMVMFGKNANNLWHGRFHRPIPALAPTNVAPANGVQAPSATPEVSFRVRLGKKWPQSKHKAVWQFATNNTFTANVRTFTQDDSKFITIENTEATTSYYYFSDVLPSNLALSSGTWYVRAALVDEFGTAGEWSAINSFTLSHPPAAANLLPDNGQVLNSGAVDFSWTFTDPSETDVQTAFQLIVEINDTGQVIHDSGKITSGAKTYSTNIAEAYAGQLLRWTIRLWDGDDTAGAYAAYRTFQVAGAPTLVLNSPANGATVTSATPQVAITPTISGGRSITKYQVIVLRNGAVYEDSGVLPTNVTTGTQLIWRPSKMQEDGQNYTVQAVVGDELGLMSNIVTATYLVDYASPPAPASLTGSVTQYNTDGLAYVEITWPDTRDADFEKWIVERRINELNYSTVISVGAWEVVDEVTTGIAGTAIWWDFEAPSGVQVEYRVRQQVNRNGDRALSTGEPTRVLTPVSEGYWLIVPGDTATAYKTYKLDAVTDDSYTDEYEETTYTVVGRGRHVDRGDHLGVSGNLTCKLRNGATKSARVKRREIMGAKDAGGVQFLRTPFGDVWPVSVGNIGVGRIAGTGKDEHVDLTIPYLEIFEEDED